MYGQTPLEYCTTSRAISRSEACAIYAPTNRLITSRTNENINRSGAHVNRYHTSRYVSAYRYSRGDWKNIKILDVLEELINANLVPSNNRCNLHIYDLVVVFSCNLTVNNGHY